MASNQLSFDFDLFNSNLRQSGRARTGQMVPCDECRTLHWRKLRQLTRRTEFKKDNPVAGMWFCSRACLRAVSNRRSVIPSCMNCAKPVGRFASQVKSKVFCSRECTDSFGRSMVRCVWPGCATETSCRTLIHTDRRSGETYQVYKTLLTRKGSYTRFPVCESCTTRMRTYLGASARLSNGRTHAFRDGEWTARSLNSKFMRAMLFDRAGGKCETCPTGLDWHATKTWQIDHKIPMFRGGETSLDNLQVLCGPCHQTKTAAEKGAATRERHSFQKVTVGRRITRKTRN